MAAISLKQVDTTVLPAANDHQLLRTLMSDRSTAAAAPAAAVPPWQLMLLQSQLARCKATTQLLDDEILFLHQVLKNHDSPPDVIPSSSSSEAADRHQTAKKKTCCPSYQVWIEMLTGTDMNGISHNLIHHKDRFVQTFPAVFCYPNVKNAPCRYLNDLIQPHSNCIQQYSYVFALINRDDDDDQDANNSTVTAIRVDNEIVDYTYIRVPSGCNCDISIATN